MRAAASNLPQMSSPATTKGRWFGWLPWLAPIAALAPCLFMANAAVVSLGAETRSARPPFVREGLRCDLRSARAEADVPQFGGGRSIDRRQIRPVLNVARQLRQGGTRARDRCERRPTPVGDRRATETGADRQRRAGRRVCGPRHGIPRDRRTGVENA